jgi:3-oxocholest-4-en-26-oyl-CoA dehydrogenase beta subunit
MHLSPTVEQQEIKDAVRRFCDEQVTPERLAAWEREPSGVDAACWRAACELGWVGLGVPVAAGGSGLGLVEVACLIEECARGLVPRRIINAIRGAVALAAVDPTNEALSELARGARSVALAFDEQAVRDPGLYATQLRDVRGALHLSGAKWYVADAATADLHLVAARVQDSARRPHDVALVLVPGTAARLEPLQTFDGDRQAIVHYEDVVVSRRLTAAGQGRDVLARVQRQQAALALAEMVGGMDAALAMTVEYVKQREQFGQKIAVFQAVQHQIGDMATSFTAGRHLAWQAITRLAVGTEDGSELPMAAAFVGQAFKRISLSAHHLHGGAGYVIEHPLHYHAERAQALCIRYAAESTALAEVASQLLDGDSVGS